MTDAKKCLAMLCGGGPAPGINSVISSATIHAINHGWRVLGLRDGFEHLIQGRIDEARELQIADVSRIHSQGGSILYTSRANPTKRDESAPDPDWRLKNCVQALHRLGVDALLTIGGDDTAFSASRIAAAGGGRLKVVHVPKTIDNDLPLPSGLPTFGYETARHYGTEIVANLMTDALTTRRWFFVVAMGRSAGHLALGVGKAAGATLTIIAEEFPRDERIRLEHVVDILETSMLKRATLGRPFGVAVIAEGIGERLAEDDDLRSMSNVERDEHGHIRLGELHLHRILAELCKRRFRERGQKVTIVAKNIGYELRCAPPIPFDLEYTRDLGHFAIEYLRELTASGRAEVGAMITLDQSATRALPFGSFNDPQTGRPRVRLVEIDGARYQSARRYMLRLESQDLQDPQRLGALAQAAGQTPAAFRERFGYLVAGSDQARRSTGLADG